MDYNMTAWWGSLSTFSQVLACMAIPATLVLIVQTVLMLIGLGDHDGADAGSPDIGADGGTDISLDGDAGTDGIHDGVFGEATVDGDHDPSGLEGLRIFSVRGIIAFFVVFGWVGIVLDSAGVNQAISILISAACGFAVMVLIALLFKAVMKLQNEGNIDNRNALGVSGRVYLTVPANREGEGKVNVTIQGTYCERAAVTDETEELRTGSEVVVIGVSGQDTLVVKKK